MFKEVNQGGYKEYHGYFGIRNGGRFISLCLVRADREQFEEAYDIYRMSGFTSPITIYKTTMVIYDRRVLEYADAHLYRPEKDDYVKFHPGLWQSPDILDYGVFTGGKLFLYDVVVQIHRAGAISARQNLAGGLIDEEGEFTLTSFTCFVDYL